MEKYKKIQKYKAYFFYLFGILFVFFVFLLRKTKNTKKKYECNFSKIQNTKKKQKISKIQNTKKKYEPKISKIQNTKKYEFKNEPESQPHVHFEKQEPTCKLNANPPCFIIQLHNRACKPFSTGIYKIQIPKSGVS